MKLNPLGTRDRRTPFAEGKAAGSGGAPSAGLNRRAASAYTIAEMLVAVLILATMVVSLYGGFSAGFAIVRANRDELHATQILTRQVEALRLCAWTQLANRSSLDCYNPQDPGGTGGTVFGVTVSTNAPDSIPDGAPYKADMRLVTVTVWWTNFNSDTPIVHSRQAQTHVARYGAQNCPWGGTP